MVTIQDIAKKEKLGKHKKIDNFAYLFEGGIIVFPRCHVKDLTGLVYARPYLIRYPGKQPELRSIKIPK